MNGYKIIMFAALAASVGYHSESGAATVSAFAAATIIAPVTITSATSMLFEKLSSGGFGSAIVVGSSYQAPVRGAEERTQGGASITIADTANTTFYINIPPDVTIRGGSSGDTTLQTAARNGFGSYFLGRAEEVIPVLGNLQVEKSQVAGTYKGQLDITVYYN